jgi:hypothetical protein
MSRPVRGRPDGGKAADRGDLVYVYCLVATRARRVPGRLPAGLPETTAPRALPIDPGLWLVVADAPRVRYGSEAIARRLQDLDWVSACAAAHEAVVEHAGRAGTVVPLKLFTLFDSEARARAHIAGLRPTLARMLERIAGCEEWGIRVRLHVGRLREARRRAAGRAAPPASGAAFLRRKLQEREAAHRLTRHGRREVEAMFERLADVAADVRRRPPVAVDGVRLVLDAAFLVARGRLARFKAVAREAGRRLRASGYELTLSGPWPAYHFVDAGR